MKIQVHTLNSFTNNKKGGNPAGIVLEADTLSNSQMEKIAKEVGFSETAFISKSKVADYKISFFTPCREVDICGHASMAAAFLLRKQKVVDDGEITQEVKNNILRILLNENKILVEQSPPKFEGYVDKKTIAGILGTQIKDIDEKLNPEIVSTGLRDIIVPIKSLQALKNIKPNFDGLSKFNQNTSTVGFHAFSTETIKKESTAHTRNFAPLYGIEEEAATGTSNGALACYLYKYGLIKKTKNLQFEQGYSFDLPSLIIVDIKTIEEKIKEVWVGGEVVFKEKVELSI